MSSPRRAVVDSYKRLPEWGNWFSCTLECGHVVVAKGRTRAPGQRPQAPSTCACSKCATIAKAPTGTEKK